MHRADQRARLRQRRPVRPAIEGGQHRVSTHGPACLGGDEIHRGEIELAAVLYGPLPPAVGGREDLVLPHHPAVGGRDKLHSGQEAGREPGHRRAPATPARSGRAARRLNSPTRGTGPRRGRGPGAAVPAVGGAIAFPHPASMIAAGRMASNRARITHRRHRHLPGCAPASPERVV
jgi:hypothetical protein